MLGDSLVGRRSRVKGGSPILASRAKAQTKEDLEAIQYLLGVIHSSTPEDVKTLPLSVLRLVVALRSLEKDSEPSSSPRED